MVDKYRSFAELVSNEKQDQDFRVHTQKRSGTIVIIAPHGGGIEPGTSEIAEAIASEDLSFYAFEGMKSTDNRDLHITSTRFDEPQCMALVSASPGAISVHGEDSEREVVFLGGRDAAMLNRLRNTLARRGFTVESHEDPLLQGQDLGNMCNKTKNGAGVQLEISKGLRLSFFKSLSRIGRGSRTERFEAFVAALREAIL
jgi:phage replication-related protein YjqB (UPF0714/DUF867 family)